MATWRDWDKLKISGRTLVSNFSSLDCTNEHSVEYFPEQLVEPGQVLASFGPDYYSVILDHFEDGDAFIRVKDKVYKVEPNLKVYEKKPLSYAWSEMSIQVSEPVKSLKEVLLKEDASEWQTKDAVDWCLEHPNEVDNKMLEEAAQRLYVPKYRILDHQKAKLCYTLLAELPDCKDKLKYKCYCRLTRLSYLGLNEEEGDRYAKMALEIYPDKIEPLLLGVDYEWFMHLNENYGNLYREGKLPRIKSLVDQRRWEAMAYLLDKIIPLQDEGMRAYAELCETVLKETFRKSGERNFDAIAFVSLWKFMESTDYFKFTKSWYNKQLEKGVQSPSEQARYYYAFVKELTGRYLYESGEVDTSEFPIRKAMDYYRKCVDFLDRRAMAGLANLMVDYDPENPNLQFYIKSLRAFSYKGQEYPFLDEYNKNKVNHSD